MIASNVSRLVFDVDKNLGQARMEKGVHGFTGA